MRAYKALIVQTMAVLSLAAAVPAEATEWTVTRLTDNDYPDNNPRISGSTVVWECVPEYVGGPGTDDSEEICIYDGALPSRQLTDNEYCDRDPEIDGVLLQSELENAAV